VRQPDIALAFACRRITPARIAMARRITVVVSQGQSANPAKRKLEEDLVAALLFERGVEVTVVPHLYDLTPDGTGMLCLRGIAGDMVLLSWLYPRAARWILDRNDVRGQEGTTLLVADEDEDDDDEEERDLEEDGNGESNNDGKLRVLDSRPPPARKIYCIDLRTRSEVESYVEEIRRIVRDAQVQTVDLAGWINGAPRSEQMARFLSPAPGNVDADGRGPDGNGAPATVTPRVGEAPAEPASNPSPAPAQPQRVAEEAPRRWYPVIDLSRCTNCLECLDFCLFGVYGIDKAETILVEQPDNCRKGCPACSRVCPENAIIFPQHKTPAIAGSPEGSVGALKIDLSKLFGAPEGLEAAVHERDVELVAAGRDAVGATVGMPKRQQEKPAGPKDDLDKLMDQVDDLL
jgi:NAD-dependent dihydropyrimidine dehydrogenase PreA subunit